MWIEAEPGNALRECWVYLTPDEARDLLAALEHWAGEDPPDPGWHTHIADSGREVTIAINPDEGKGRFDR